MKRTVQTFAIAAVFLCAQAALAQQPYQSGGYAIRPTGNGTPVVYHHASTYEEGVLRGHADWLRGLGDYLYSASLASINFQEANRRGMENHKRAVEQYFELRNFNRQARAAERGPRPTREDLERYARLRNPQPLEAHQFNADLGVLRWPASLQGPEFASERAAIDRLMADRTPRDSGRGSQNCQQIQQLARHMQDLLISCINGMSPSQYTEAKDFLNRVKFEAQLPVMVTHLAAN